jgi:hypothetical protein
LRVELEVTESRCSDDVIKTQHAPPTSTDIDHNFMAFSKLNHVTDRTHCLFIQLFVDAISIAVAMSEKKVGIVVVHVNGVRGAG